MNYVPTWLQTTQEVITPQLAARWLEHQTGNRRLKARVVKALRDEIVSGNWQLTHQGIAFDNTGRLLDGQHRLAAIVAADMAVPMMVTRGLDREASLRAVDQGTIRSRGELFTMRGEAYGTQKAAICRTISCLLTADLPYSGSVGPTVDARILENYRSEIETVLANRHKDLTARFCAVAVLMLHKDTQVGLDFVVGVSSGVGMSADDPRFALREYLMKRTGKLSGSSDCAEIILRSACAAQAYASGDRLVHVKSSATRYLAFCKYIGIPVNRSLFVASGGGLLPSEQSPARAI